MSEYEFSLAIAGSLEDDATLDVLFEAGCNDATFGQVDDVGYADFVRAAPTFAAAVRSAIEQVESTGLRVVRIEPDDLVTMSEIAQRLGRSRGRLFRQGGSGGRSGRGSGSRW